MTFAAKYHLFRLRAHHLCLIETGEDYAMSDLNHWKPEFEELKTALTRFHGVFLEHAGIDLHQPQYAVLPPPLKAFYEFVGDRLAHGEQGIIVYNTFLSPGEIEVTPDIITFYRHEGGAFKWAAERNAENPKVLRITMDREGREIERVYEVEYLSGFLFQICLYETALGFPYQISFHSHRRHDLETIVQQWQRFPFQSRLPDDTVIPNIFLYTPQALGFLWFGNHPSPQTIHTFYCAAQHPKDLEGLKPLTETIGISDYHEYTEDMRAQGYWEFMIFHEGPCSAASFWADQTEKMTRS
jgi:hypothetical protein